MERFIADAGPFDVVVCVRFLQRECFDSIAQLVAPGGFLVYQHFREGVQHSRIGRPNHPRVCIPFLLPQVSEWCQKKSDPPPCCGSRPNPVL